MSFGLKDDSRSVSLCNTSQQLGLDHRQVVVDTLAESRQSPVKENEEDKNEEDKKERDEEEEDEEEQGKDKKKSDYKYGVIYLNRIPQGRNYTRLREIFTPYGEVGNIYLVPDKYANERMEKKGKFFKCYAEGFVEFKKKKVAKMVAELLNGQPIEKSKNGVKGFIWDIQYLHRCDTFAPTFDINFLLIIILIFSIYFTCLGSNGTTWWPS